MSWKTSGFEIFKKLKEDQARDLTDPNFMVYKKNDFFEQIIQASPIPAFVINTDHKITLFNKALENLTGVSAADAVGTNKQWWAFYDKPRPVLADLIVDKASERKIQKIYSGRAKKSKLIEGAYEVESFFPNLGESGKWLFFTAAPLKDDTGRIIGAIETLQDITLRKRAESEKIESEKRYKAFIDFSPYPIALLTPDEKVVYVNPSFTHVFGWEIDELKGKSIPFVPKDNQHENIFFSERFSETNKSWRAESKRLTKDGRILDVVIRVNIFYEQKGKAAGYIVFFRDISEQKRIEKNNELMLKISMKLPEYPDLEELMDYTSEEIKENLNAEGALVILLDQELQQFYFQGAAYDDENLIKKVKGARFSLDQLVAGEVVRTGKTVIVSNTSEEASAYLERDKILGYSTRNLLEIPLKSKDNIIGVLCAINKKEGDFDHKDADLLNMIGSTVALSVENARFSLEIKKAHQELSNLNIAKNKAINHLSHELRLPVSILGNSIGLIGDLLEELGLATLQDNIRKVKENLSRIVAIQTQVADIMKDKTQKSHFVMSKLLDQCMTTIETAAPDHEKKNDYIAEIRKRIDEIFGVREDEPVNIILADFVKNRISLLTPILQKRNIKIKTNFENTHSITIPREALEKIFDGIIKNAIENTPDQGLIEVSVLPVNSETKLVIHDYGVGIVEEHQQCIFQGFFHTHETLNYSSRKPYEFGAGGSGADLLRIKIFSERYNFQIQMTSKRCKYLTEPGTQCPGIIEKCQYIKNVHDCMESGGTEFSLYFSSQRR